MALTRRLANTYGAIRLRTRRIEVRRNASAKTDHGLLQAVTENIDIDHHYGVKTRMRVPNRAQAIRIIEERKRAADLAKMSGQRKKPKTQTPWKT